MGKFFAKIIRFLDTCKCIKMLKITRSGEKVDILLQEDRKKNEDRKKWNWV